MIKLPEISRFYGVVVKIYLIGREHNPPHVHFLYGERMASYDIQSLKLLEVDLPPKAASMCLEWLTIHKEELLEMWDTQVFRKLPPLE